jgi:acetyl esterase/lipase
MKCLFLTALSFSVIAAVVVAAPHEEPVSKPTESPTTLLPVKVQRDILYETIDKQKLYLDLAMPKEGGPYPCVVMFHGGAWLTGSRRDLSVGDRGKNGKVLPSVIELVASHGYVVVSVGYRLAPKFQFPAQIEDARSAVRFLRANAKKYNIQPNEIAAMGFSAGGHLALLLGLANNVKSWDVGNNTNESTQVQCVVDYFGPTDLSLYANSPGLEDAYLVPVFGKACKTDPDVYKKASPISYVSKDAPPILMIHGTFDLIVPIIHSENLLKKLKGVGTTAKLITVSGEGHGWVGLEATRTTNEAITFLNAHLKKKGQK